MTKHVTIGVILVLLVPIALAQTPRQRRPAPRPRVSNTLRILNQRLPEIEFVEQPFDQVMEWIGELTGLSVVVRWQTLEDAGVDRDTAVSIKARNLRLSQVLWLIMNEVGGSEIKLAYRASGSLLVLSTEEDLSKEMITRVYDVSDLLINIPRASRQAAFDVTQGLGQEGGGGGGQGMFGQNQQDQQRGEDPRDRGGTDTEMDTLIDLIQQAVEPDSWVSNGGVGTIYPFRRLLVIHNTILVHQRLGGYITEEGIVGP